MILYQSNCSTFDVFQFCNCNLRITDKYDQYCDKNITYRDAVTLDIIIYNNSKNQQIIATAFTDHTQGWLNEVNLPIGTDGYYTIYHIILPTVIWFNRNSSNKSLSKYKNIYVTDCKNVYKVINNELVPFNVNSLIELDLKYSTAIRFEKEIFLTCHLQKCFMKYSLQDDDKFYRKFLWASLEVIDILIKSCRLEDAELLIEELLKCGGLCYSITTPLQQKTITSDNSFLQYIDGNCNCNK